MFFPATLQASLDHLFSHPYFNSKKGQQLGLAVTIFFIILIVLVLLKPLSVYEETKIKPLPPLKQLANVSTIASWHLFGNPLSGTDIPLTMLPLKLDGVFYSENGQRSTVIITGPNGPSKIYREGSIVAGALIEKILPRSILLRNEGRLERLLLPQKRLFMPVSR